MDKLNLEKVLLDRISANYEWEDYYINFIKKLEQTKIKSIEEIINSL